MSLTVKYIKAIFLPGDADHPADWTAVRRWIRRPSTIIAFLIANAYIIANYMSHRLMVQGIYKFWETFDGVKCGTGILENHVAVVMASLVALIPIGIAFIAYTGLGTEIRTRDSSEDRMACLLYNSAPWIYVSALWVIWLLLINAIVFNITSPERGMGMGIIEDFFEIPFLAIAPMLVCAYIGGWFGLAIPSIMARLQSRKWQRQLAIAALLVGCIMFIPILIGQVLIHDGFRDLFSSLMNFFEAATFATAIYLLMMTLSVSHWLAQLAQSPPPHTGLITAK